MGQILLTGCAGFIGMHAALRLLARGDEVVGIDNLSPYYDPRLKQARLARLQAHPGFRWVPQDLADLAGTQAALAGWQPEKVLHLAGQPGVRYSIDHPHSYAQANLVAFLNVLELCRHWQVEHLAYASSSSVYGANARLPFHENHPVDHPVSLYAATKKANELMAHTYSHLYGLPTSGLRFFTVYGPWGRPDMAPFKFVRAMLAGETLDIYNHGQQMRDFTYVDDIVESALRVLDRPATADPGFDRQHPDSASSFAPYRIFNIGNANPVPLLDFVQAIENALGLQAHKRFLPAQPGDVEATFADTHTLRDWVGFQPTTPLAVGIERFVAWYLDFHGNRGGMTPDYP